MSDLAKKFQEIMEDIEKNIKDEKELEYVNKKISEISMMYMDIIDNMNDVIQNKLTSIEKFQNSIETKVNKIQTSIAGIENDIYDEGYDFEIVCPYCNAEFTANIEEQSDIKCPECQNVIEFDWNENDDFGGCSGSCSTCSSKCGEEEYDDDDDDDM